MPIKPENDWDSFRGPLDPSKLMGWERSALMSYYRQRNRCINKKNRAYRYYGAKGIRVEYSAREFVGWWGKSLISFDGHIPSCGRIDHSKNYCFGNIALEDLNKNRIDGLSRCDDKRSWNRKPVLALDAKTMQILSSHDSTYSAGEHYGVSPILVWKHCTKLSTNPRLMKIVFRYK